MGIARDTVHQLNNRTSRHLTLAALAILVAALLVRVIHLDADPSALLSRDFITDEGWWAHNARNALLYGEWKIDEFNQGLYSAYLYNVILYLTIKLLGVSFTSIRLVPALAGWLSVVLIFLTVRREINSRAALFASVLLGFSNLHLIYSRIGFAESTIVFFLALMLWLWSLRSTHSCFALLSGAAFGLMLVTKVTAIYFIPGFIPLVAVEAIRRTTKLKHALMFLLGSVVVVAGYAILFVLPNFREWLSFNLANGAGTEWSSGPLTLVYSTLKLLGSSFFAKAPVVTALSLLALCLLIISMSRDGFKKAIRSASELELSSATLLIGYLFSLALTIYQPERRFLPALFLMIILAAGVLERGWASLEQIGDAGYRMSWTGWFAILFFLPAIGILEIKTTTAPMWAWLFKIIIVASLIALAGAIARKRFSRQIILRLLAASKVIFLLLFSFLSLAIVYKTLGLWGIDAARLSSASTVDRVRIIIIASAVLATCTGLIIGMMRSRQWRPVWLLGAFLLIEGSQISTWLMQPSYSLRDANATLSETLSRDDTVVTYYETALVSTQARVITRSPRRGFNVDAFDKFDPRYILVLRRDNWRSYALDEMPIEEWPPPVGYSPEKIAEFDLCPTRLAGPRFVIELYRITRLSEAAERINKR